MLLEILLKGIPFIRKGAFTSCVWHTDESNVKAEFKKKGYKLEKECKGVVRIGIKYKNLKEIKELGIDPQPLNGYTWSPNYEDYILLNKNNESQLRVYPSKKHHTKVIYKVNGEVVDKAKYQSFLIDSAKKDKEKPLCFNIKVKNIRKLGSLE